MDVISAPSKDLDLHVHASSLIKTLAWHILDSQECKVSSSGQQRLGLDCADVQADLSLRWARTSDGTISYVAAYFVIPFYEFSVIYNTI